MAEVFDINIAIANSNDILAWVDRISLEIEAGFAKAGEKGGQKLSQGVKDGLKATVADAQAPLEELGNSFDALGSRISRILEIATGVGLERLFESAIGGAKDFIKTGVDMMGTLQETRIGFEAMTGSADIASGLLYKLSNFAKTTPFELPELQENARRLMAVGFSAKQILPVMEDMGTIASIVGREKLPFLVRALGDVKVAGKLMGGEILQFKNAGVPILELLGKQLGVTTSQAREMASEGKIGFTEVGKALEDYAKNKAPNIMQKLSLGYKGVVSNLRDSFDIFTRSLLGMNEAGDVIVGGFFSKLEGAVQKLGIVTSNFISLLQGKIDFSKFLMMSGFSKTATKNIVNLGNGIKFVWDILGKGANLIGSALNSPLGQTVVVLGLSYVAFVRTAMVIASMIGNVKKLGTALRGLKEVTNIIGTDTKVLGGIFGSFSSSVSKAKAGIVAMMSGMRGAITGGFRGLVVLTRTGMARVSLAMLSFTANPFKAIGGIFVRMGVAMKAGFGGLRTIAMTGVKGIFGAMKGLVMGMVGILTSPIVILVVAVGGLFLAWQTNFLGIRDFTNGIIQNIGNMLIGFSTFILANIDAIARGIKSGVNVMIGIFNGLSKFLTGPVVGTFAFLAKTATLLIGGMVGGILKLGGFMMKNFGGSIKSMVSFAIDQLTGLGMFAIDFGGAIVSIFGGIGEFVTGAFLLDWKMMAVGMLDIFGGVVGGVGAIADGIGRVIVNAINAVIAMINAVLDNPIVQKGLELIGLGGARVGNVSFGFSFADAASGAIASAKAAMGQSSNSGQKDNKSQFQGMMDGLKKGINGADTNAISDAMNGMADGVISGTVSAIDAIGKGAKSAIDNPIQLGELNDGALAGIKSALTGLAGGLKSAGEGIKGITLGAISDPIGMIKGLLGFGGGDEGKFDEFKDPNSNAAADLASDRADYDKMLKSGEGDNDEGKVKKSGGGKSKGGTGSPTDNLKEANEQLKLQREQEQLAKNALNDKINDEKDLAKTKEDAIKKQEESELSSLKNQKTKNDLALDEIKIKELLLAKNDKEGKAELDRQKAKIQIDNIRLGNLIKEKEENFKKQIEQAKLMSEANIKTLKQQKDEIDSQIQQGKVNKFNLDLAKYFSQKYKGNQQTQSQVNNNNTSTINNNTNNRTSVVNQNYNPSFNNFVSGLSLA